jgi:hypothetical protein
MHPIRNIEISHTIVVQMIILHCQVRKIHHHLIEFVIISYFYIDQSNLYVYIYEWIANFLCPFEKKKRAKKQFRFESWCICTKNFVCVTQNAAESHSLINIDYMILIVSFMVYIHVVTLSPRNDFHIGFLVKL